MGPGKISARPLLLLLLTLALQGRGTVTAQTQQLPDFTLSRSDGRPFNRADLPKTGPTLFVLFDPTCPHCQQAVKHLGEYYQKLRKAEICLVSMEDWAAIHTFMSTYGSALKGRSNVVVLRDSTAAFITRLAPRRIPAMLLFNAAGKLVEYEDNENTVFRLAKSPYL